MRDIRDRKGLTLKQLADLTGGRYAFQTIGAYEKSEKPLPLEFLEVMAEVLETTKEKIQPDELREDAIPYRGGFDLEGFSKPNLEQVFDSILLDYRDPKTGPERKIKSLANIAAVADELRRRLELEKETKL